MNTSELLCSVFGIELDSHGNTTQKVDSAVFDTEAPFHPILLNGAPYVA